MKTKIRKTPINNQLLEKIREAKKKRKPMSIDKDDLKVLQSERLLNMSRVYKELGYTPAEINTRLGRPNSSLDQEVLEKIEKQIMDNIANVVQILDLDPGRVVSRILAESKASEATSIFKELEDMAVPPVAYVEKGDRMFALFLPDDAYKPRITEHQTIIEYHSIQKIKGMIGHGAYKNFRLTNRGRVAIQATS